MNQKWIWFLFLCLQVSFAQDAEITADTQKTVVDQLGSEMIARYVFPEVGQKMSDHLHQRLQEGAYASLTNAQAFAQTLTEDLRSISKDLHIRVRWYAEPPLEPESSEADRLAAERHNQEANYGFRQVELLPGNLGYLRLDGFFDSSTGGPTAIAAMNFLAHCDALIIDLRQNGGGSPSMIGLITSYFFEEPVHLNSFYVRETDSLRQYWTSANVVGPRMASTPIYVLTSQRTFSAAEEFSYNLKNLKRATLVGETTGGGAHPVNSHYFEDTHFGVSIPFGRAINPITGTNWEGVGVVPDIAVAADQALETAKLRALQDLKQTQPDRASAYQWHITWLEAQTKPVVLKADSQKAYVGQYGPRIVTLEQGSLFYSRANRPKIKMVPLGPDLFGFVEYDDFRLQFKRESGKVTSVSALSPAGEIDHQIRN